MGEQRLPGVPLGIVGGRTGGRGEDGGIPRLAHCHSAVLNCQSPSSSTPGRGRRQTTIMRDPGSYFAALGGQVVFFLLASPARVARSVGGKLGLSSDGYVATAPSIPNPGRGAVLVGVVLLAPWGVWPWGSVGSHVLWITPRPPSTGSCGRCQPRGGVARHVREKGGGLRLPPGPGGRSPAAVRRKGSGNSSHPAV